MEQKYLCEYGDKLAGMYMDVNASVIINYLFKHYKWNLESTKNKYGRKWSYMKLSFSQFIFEKAFLDATIALAIGVILGPSFKKSHSTSLVMEIKFLILHFSLGTFTPFLPWFSQHPFIWCGSGPLSSQTTW